MKTFEEIIASLPEEDKKVIQSFADKRVAQALKTYGEKNPSLPEAGKRLEKIKVATESKIKSLELKNKVIQKCFEKSIDYNSVEKLGITFNDEKEIDSKLEVLEKNVALKNNAELNKLLASGTKPNSSQARETPIKDFNYYKHEAEVRDQK